MLVVNVQILRFVAAMLVVLAHGVDLVPGRVPDSIGNFGASGVDIFFVISGYIITRSAFLGRGRAAGEFALHRIRRVVPLYWLMSLPWLAITLADGSFWIRRVVVTLTFWPALWTRTINPLLEIGWTLCFEMLFYAGATVVLLSRRRVAVTGLLAAFALCWVLRITTGLGPFRFLGNPIVIEFLFGIGVAVIEPRIGRLVAAIALIGGTALMLASIGWGFGAISESAFTLDGSLSLRRVVLWGVPSALIVAGAVGMSPWTAGKPRDALVMLGDASYSLYLVHPLVMWVGERFAGALSPAMLFAVTVTASLAAGVAVHLWIERPLLRRLNRTRRVMPSDRPPPETALTPAPARSHRSRP